MSVDISGLVAEGFDRTVSRNGLLLVAIFYLVGVPNAVVTADLRRGLAGGTATSPATVPTPGLTPAAELGLSVAVAGLLALALWAVSTVVTIGAIRTFLGADTETIDTSDFTRDLGWLFVNLLVGGLVFGLLVGIGVLLLVVPGVFLLVSLYFWNFVVVDEGANFVDGLERSWSLTSGERLELFLLGVVVAVVQLLVNVVFGLPGAVLPALAAPLFGQIGSAFGTVFVLATGARTYRALGGGDGGPADAGGGEEPVGTEHALE